MGLAVAAHIASGFTGRVQLFVFPYLLERLIHTRHEPSAHLPALSRLIGMDPALCFMAMGLDRAMGSDTQTADTAGIDDLVSRIGITGIDAMTTRSLADQALNGVHHQRALALEWLWRHGLTTALLAEKLALELNFRPVEEAYVAGLLHDIGKLVLFARTPAACIPMLADPILANPLLEAEERVAGSNHGRIGAQLIRRQTRAWFAADPARYHTATSERASNALPLVQIVWAANRLAAMPHPSAEAHQTVAALLNLDPRHLAHLTQTAERQVLTVAEELGVAAYMQEKGSFTDTHIVPLNHVIRTKTVLSSVYADLLTVTDHSSIIRVLRQSLSVFLGIDALLMFDYEPQSDHLIGRFAAGRAFPLPANRLRIPLTPSSCLPAICHATGEVVDSFSRARRDKLTIIDQQLMGYMHTDGIVCIPLRSQTDESRAACLLMGIDVIDWPWIEQQATLLKAIAAAVAQALEREQHGYGERHVPAVDRAASRVSRTRRIVHEINNPLSIIKNYLKVLTLRTDADPSGKDELRIIDEEINRVTDLIKSLTAPSETIPMDLATVDVNATITDILGLFRESQTGKTTIRLSQDLDARIPLIPSDRDRLKQALINLLKNAMEAMYEGGTILVRTRMLSRLPHDVDHLNGADQVRISICDDGPGIDEGIKNDLFKPHVTSKMGHDGLGLSIVQEAVRQLKGSLLLESTLGRGTCFHIELPMGKNTPINANAPDSTG